MTTVTSPPLLLENNQRFETVAVYAYAQLEAKEKTISHLQSEFERQRESFQLRFQMQDHALERQSVILTEEKGKTRNGSPRFESPYRESRFSAGT